MERPRLYPRNHTIECLLRWRILHIPKLCGGPNRKDSKLRIDCEALEFLDDVNEGQILRVLNGDP